VPSRVASVSVGVALSLALGAACSSDDDPRPSRRWAALAPPGYETGDRYVLDLDGASRSTPVPDDLTRKALRSSDFESGEAQVFTSGQDFAVVSEYRFPTLDSAAGFVEFEVAALRRLGTVAVLGTAGVPGATTYVLHAPTRARGREVFCEGVVFAVSEAAYLVTRCGPHPSSADTAESLAARLRAAVTAAASPKRMQASARRGRQGSLSSS
jgi:hypothetical protein